MIRVSTVIVFSPPHLFEPLFLDEVQKFGLKGCGQISNFIEEDGSAVAGFKASRLILDCAVESTARMAKQLALEKMFRMSAGVDGHERTFGAKTPSMDLMRQNILARAALAGEKYHCVAEGGALRLLQQSSHHGVVRFEQWDEIVGGVRHPTIRIFACFVHRRPLLQRSVPPLKPDNVDAKALTTDQQVGINRAPE